METFTLWCSLHGLVMFLLLTTIDEGSSCEAPSSPWCFRRNVDKSMYLCEWSMNTNESNVTFDLYFNKTKIGNIKKNFHEVHEEVLIKNRSVDIWVEARVGNSICPSPKRSVVLAHIVKYEAPQNVSVTWLKTNLSLSWPAAERNPALAEVWYRRDRRPSESWEKKLININNKNYKYQVTAVNLLKDSVYQVQIRQQSTSPQVKTKLWSDWSPVVTVPAELEHEPEVSVTTTLLNGTRMMILTWKPVPTAASVTGVTYSVSDSSQECPCKRRKRRKRRTDIETNKYTVYVSYSAVNISVIAKNAAGRSPPAVIEEPAVPVADLKLCDKTLLGKKLIRTTCLQWYELQEADPRPKNVINVSGRMKKQERKLRSKNIKNYTRYLYFEHRCVAGKPQTVNMCLFYQKQGVPLSTPLDFTVFSETHNSAHLSWKPIPYEDQRGFITHYNLCITKIDTQHELIGCYNISSSLLKYRLENLTPGSKYNTTLAALTQIGEGPRASVIINTQPEKPVNVWLSLGLLFVFFVLSTTCTIILKRIQNKLFPPVPTPVIPDFTLCQPESPDMMERKEEVHELTLHHILPAEKTVTEKSSEEVGEEWDDRTDEDVEDGRSDSEGSSDECPDFTVQALWSSRKGEVTEIEQADNELELLIYRNGLVFDVKTDLDGGN
ncbi:leukemia inhibitory factor receptor [Parambassis ranga]|uniref:Leukemia inhibitory factor receptor n=1 Tax=Parambassis ranga TaxID=210632 RepID=A0A6P7I9M8_9TELE|nr:interleukin-12 receptor subunit beta-1 [Parambassis ranga]